MEGTGSSISRMWWSWGESSTCSPCVFWMTGRSLARTRMGTVLESRVREWSVPAGERTTGERATGERGYGRTYYRRSTTGKHTAGDHTEGERAAREDPAGDVPEYAIRQSDDLRKDTGTTVAVAGQSRCGILFPEGKFRDTCGCIATGIRAGKTCSGMRPMC